jgi:hypothetical protein
LVQTYNRFADHDVQFFGLTPDGAEARSEIEEFQSSAEIPWPTGIGARETISAYGVEFLPTLFVIGRDGKVYWNSGMTGNLEEAIQGALDQKG